MIQTSLFSQIITKKCNKCGEIKSFDEFFKDSRNKNRRWGYCKKCKLVQSKEYYKNNPEKEKIIIEKHKEWVKNNPEKNRKSKKKWRENNSEKVKAGNKKYREENFEKEKARIKKWAEDNPEKVNAKSRKYYKNNPEKVKATNKNWRDNNPEKAKNASKQWKENNLEKAKETDKKWRRNKRKTDIHFRIKTDISNMINIKLKKRLLSKNNKSTFGDILPYKPEDLMNHLENQFESWMNWDNRGIGKGFWNIDHIIPDYRFNYTSIEDPKFQACWSLENLRPLEAITNLTKGKRLDFDDKQKETLEILNKKFDLKL